jgi:TldD protein
MLFSVGLWAQPASSDPVLGAMQQELDRSIQNLKKAPVPPYFLSYQLTDNRNIQIAASFGALTNNSDRNTRYLDLDLRVGGPSLDNTHPIREQNSFGDAVDQLERQKIPLDDDPDALRVALWHETERKYRIATQRLQRVKANVQVKVEAEDRSGDFSKEGPEVYSEAVAPFSFDSSAWKQKMRKFTAPFSGHKEIIENSAEVIAEIETRRYVNSDGSRIRIS